MQAGASVNAGKELVNGGKRLSTQAGDVNGGKILVNAGKSLVNGGKRPVNAGDRLCRWAFRSGPLRTAFEPDLQLFIACGRDADDRAEPALLSVEPRGAVRLGAL